ncbi:MAG: hypothetical protein IIZ48_01020 [Erysipelotrichales bacterium]|nr:hypothetical protein [Erysipelotrichales bacterium]
MPVRDPADRLLIGQAESISNRAGKLFGDIMRHTLKSQAINGLAAGPVHDVTAVMYLVHPEFFTTKKMYAAIDLSKGLSYGRTVCDINNRYKKKPKGYCDYTKIKKCRKIFRHILYFRFKVIFDQVNHRITVIFRDSVMGHKPVLAMCRR